MADTVIPLELISNFLSLLVLLVIFYRYFEYKKKMDVIEKLKVLKETGTLTSEDKEFVKTNLMEYDIEHQKIRALIKFTYPLFILIAGVLFMMFNFTEAMIHLNVVIVIFIFLQVKRIHSRNFVTLLQDI